jgi:uncharacterized protein VirK/YbjX
LVGVYWRAAREAWHWSRHVHRLDPGRFKLFKRHLRWAAAAALRPEETLGWFSFHGESDMQGFVHANPRLIFRALSSYMSVRWGSAKRIKVIQDTYLCVTRRGGFLAEAMRDPQGRTLAHLDLDRGQKARVRIGSDGQFRKEGEICVFLELEGIVGAVSGMAFSLEENGEWSILIGGFQGRRGGGEETIKLATKAMHGLRPKNLMVLLAQDLAHLMGASSLRGVGNQVQVFRARLNHPWVPARNIRFNFDDLWTEVGGQPREDGWFDLPLTTPRRGPEDIKPNKRSMYAKRYALLDQLQLQVRQNLMS